jgi:hypothetical protein
MMTTKLQRPDTECVTARCWCHYEVRRDNALVASCVTVEAMHAAQRLLGGGA